MNQNLTVSVKTLLLSVLVVAALVAAYLLGGAGGADAGEERATGDDRTLAMRGVGKVTAVPDQLSFTVAVTVKEDDVAPAMDRANATMAKVLKALTKHGVTKADTQSTGLGISPQYDYRQHGEPLLTGYRVNQQVRVTVTQLAKAGKAISAAVEAGGNAVRVRNIALGLGNPDALLADARDAAVTEATEKARQYADATGQELGGVVSLKEVTPNGGGHDGLAFENAYRGRLVAADLSAMPVRAGEKELSVTVQVVWAFE